MSTKSRRTLLWVLAALNFLFAVNWLNSYLDTGQHLFDFGLNIVAFFVVLWALNSNYETERLEKMLEEMNAAIKKEQNKKL